MFFKYEQRLRKLFFCLIISLSINSAALAYNNKDSVALSQYMLAVIDEQSGKIDDAIEEYKKVLKVDYENSVVHLGLASAYLRKKEISTAIEELNLAIKFEPEAVEPHAVLALLYFSQNKLEEASREYEAALENASKIQPQNTDIYKNLGIVYLRQKKYEAAEKIYRSVINITPGDAEAYFYLGSISDELKKRQEAFIFFKKALEIKPDYSAALNYLGYLYAQENINLDTAEAMIKKAMAIEPNNGAFVDSLGWVYFKKAKFKEAIKFLEKAALLLADPVIYDHLGDAYFKIKQPDKAKINWQKSLGLEPKQETVKKKLESLGI